MAKPTTKQLNVPQSTGARSRSRDDLINQSQPTQNRDISTDCRSNASEPRSERFQIPSYHRKKQKRIIIGNKNNSSIKGVTNPSRHIFIYRIDSDTSESEMKAHIEENNISVRSISCISHPESRSRSFKLETSLSDYEKVFDENIWPSGVKVRKYIHPRSRAVPNDTGEDQD